MCIATSKGLAGESCLLSRRMELYSEHGWIAETRDVAVGAVGVSWNGPCVREGNACSLLKNR